MACLVRQWALAHRSTLIAYLVSLPGEDKMNQKQLFSVRIIDVIDARYEAGESEHKMFIR